MSDQPRPVPTFDHLRSQKKPVTAKVRIFHDDETIEALEEAIERLDRLELLSTKMAPEDTNQDTLAQARADVEAARAAVAEASTVLVFRSVGRKRWEALVDEHPATPEQQAEHKAQFGEDAVAPYNIDTFVDVAIAASCVSPVMTPDEVAVLHDEWNSAEFMELWVAALAVNTHRRTAELGKAYG